MVSPVELAGVPLFDSLTSEQLVALAEWFDERTVSEGATLVGEGRSGYSFFVLLEGAAVVVADGREVAQYGPGDVFGEMAILGDGRRTATVTATVPSRVLELFGTEFRRLASEHPAIAAELEASARSRQEELFRLRAVED
jgi:CRP-like cAMP-binding protein